MLIRLPKLFLKYLANILHVVTQVHWDGSESLSTSTTNKYERLSGGSSSFLQCLNFVMWPFFLAMNVEYVYDPTQSTGKNAGILHS